MVTGVMPASGGSREVGVGHKQLVTICRVLFRAVSNRFVCALRPQTGAAYLGALYTMASAPIQSVVALALLLVLVRKHRLFCASTLLLKPSRCCRKVSYLSSFTPRSVGCMLWGRIVPWSLIASWHFTLLLSGRQL